VRQSTLHRRRELLHEALAVIDREYAADTISLGSVARSIATSRRQLQRVFGEHHTSFRRELQCARMIRAAELLSEQSLTVAQVGQAVGYREPAQFSKAFRRHHGRPPSELRASGAALAG
jgi:AraC family transcriptional regulator, regulatory protein of adaptative response / methylphosphotriester-DNA alkyltransferase methyltransferase